MITSRSTPWLTCAVGFILLAACGDSTSVPDPLDQVIVTAVDGSTSPTVERGQTVSLRARAMRGGQEVTGVRFEWASETPDLASIDSLGVVRGHEFGTARIVATPIDIGGAVGILDLPVVGPPVATVQITPAATFVDIGDAIQLTAFAWNDAGQLLSGVEYTWRSLNPNATVDATGRVTGIQPGEVQVQAVAWNEVAGTAQVRVTPITGFAPDTARYGGIISIQGAGLPANPEVYFTGASSPVRAFVRSASADAIDVWVPVGARTGRLEIVAPATSFNTSRQFSLTAQEDIFHAYACAIPCEGPVTAVELPFPYHNPSLLASGNHFNFFVFSVDQPTPFSVFLPDRGSGQVGTTMRSWMYRLEPQPEVFMSFLLTRDLINGAVLDSAVYSRDVLEPGEYLLYVNGYNLDLPESRNFTRAYGFRLTGETNFALPPDDYHPNDFPQEAPNVGLPFSESNLRFENGFAIDHYVIDVAEPSTITATLAGPTTANYLYLLEGDTLDILEAFRLNTLVDFSETGQPIESFETAVPPGRYTVVGWEFASRARSYQLSVTASASPEPVSAFNVDATRTMAHALMADAPAPGALGVSRVPLPGRPARR